MTSKSLDELLASKTPGFTLPQGFHLDPEVYQLELGRIWRRNWLFAAHTAELRSAGDRVVFDVGDDSALIVRGEDGQLRAFHNVCRHRGSRLVDSAIASIAPVVSCAGGGEFVGSATVGGSTAIGGSTAVGGSTVVGGPAFVSQTPPTSPALADGPPTFLVPGRAAAATADPFIRCPYHQWAYRLDGSLAACGGMDRMDGFDPSANGLRPLECVELGGLVFVRFERSQPSGTNETEADIHELAEPLLPQGLERAKVAYSQMLFSACRLEGTVGEQPRMLALPRRPPRVHQVSFRHGEYRITRSPAAHRGTHGQDGRSSLWPGRWRGL